MKFVEIVDNYYGFDSYRLTISACRGAIYYRVSNVDDDSSHVLDQVSNSSVGTRVGKRTLFIVTKNKSRISNYKKLLIEKMYQMLVDEISVGQYSETVGIRLKEALTCECFVTILRNKKFQKFSSELK